MFHSKVKNEITNLIRGFFFCNIISAFAKLEITPLILKKKFFHPKEFKNVKSKKDLEIVFTYLLNIGFIKKNKKKYFLTPQGLEIFRRHYSFYVPHSYNEYLSNLDNILNDSSKEHKKVNRALNILGSGMTHQRYFVTALSHLKLFYKASAILDIGVGNGDFLKQAILQLNLNKVAGIDLSKKSVSTAEKNLAYFKKFKKKLIVSNAADIRHWSKKIKSFLKGERLVITMWFLLQEIAQNKKKYVINYLKKIHSFFPNAKIIFCELVRIDSKILAANKEYSIIPEYLFFHDLSDQTVFSWKDFKEIINKSPYFLDRDYRFDEIRDDNNNSIPSTFVACLTPK